MTTATAPAPVEDPAPFTLTGNHRCDRCGAQAYAATAHVSAVLLWCAHHAREHMPMLLADERVTVIADERHKLTVETKPTL